MKKFLKFNVFVLAAIGVMSMSLASKAQDKLRPEEVIAKHLESIGSQEKRASIKNQYAAGLVQFTILRSNQSATRAAVSGKGIVLSEGQKIYYGSNFDTPNYPFDKVTFDGNNVNIGYVTPGYRSPFGNYILGNRNIFSDGLFAGTLTSSWSLLDAPSRKAKISSSGKKKIDGRETYVLDYNPKGGTNSSIKLYFDTQNFHHVRTEYKQTFSAAQGATPDSSSRQMESRHQLVEEFGDYRDEGGLILPHSYRIYLLLDGQGGTNELEWKFAFTTFAFNQNLDPKSFNIDDK